MTYMEPFHDDGDAELIGRASLSGNSSTSVSIPGAEREAAFLATLSVSEKKRLLKKLIKMDEQGVPNVLDQNSESSSSDSSSSESSSDESDCSSDKKRKRKGDKNDRKKEKKRKRDDDRNEKKKKKKKKEKSA